MKKDGVLNDVEYFRIGAAAEQLHCSPQELLHLGAIGKVEIIAPVLLAGPYEWPVGADGEAYPELEPSFRTNFDVHDRVVLLPKDIKAIESIGWATPNTFLAPSKGLEIAAHWCGNAFFKQANDDQLTHELVGWRKVYSSDIELQIQPARITKKEQEARSRMHKCATSVPWYAVKPMAGWGKAEEDGEESLVVPLDLAPVKTTIEHLFVSKNEVSRLEKSASPGSAALKQKQVGTKLIKPHGNAERYAAVREEILSFAIYCKAEWPEQCAGNVTAWAKVIDEKAGLLWDQGEPPLSRDQIERLLCKAITLVEKKNKKK